mgnify:CR=1 FL=1
MSTRILLITHAPLAEALRACALHVFPDCAGDLLVLDVPPQEPPEDTLAHARALLAQGGGAQAPTLETVFDGLADGVARHFDPGVLDALIA